MKCECDGDGAKVAQAEYSAWIASVLADKFKYSVKPTASGRRWIDTGPEAVDLDELAELLALGADYRVRLWRAPDPT